MSPESLILLERRLKSFKEDNCTAAAALVREAVRNADRFAGAEAEQALCHAIWGHLEEALENAPGEVHVELEALRFEMAGRVYASRMALGWIVRAEGAPKQPPTLRNLGI